jgi:hypothetical protein
MNSMRKDNFMADIVEDTIQSIPDDLRAELQEALDDLAKGRRRPNKIRTARAHMDRVREEDRKLFGEQNTAVELVRQARDNP